MLRNVIWIFRMLVKNWWAFFFTLSSLSFFFSSSQTLVLCFLPPWFHSWFTSFSISLILVPSSALRGALLLQLFSFCSFQGCALGFSVQSCRLFAVRWLLLLPRHWLSFLTCWIRASCPRLSSVSPCTRLGTCSAFSSALLVSCPRHRSRLQTARVLRARSDPCWSDSSLRSSILLRLDHLLPTRLPYLFLRPMEMEDCQDLD